MSQPLFILASNLVNAQMVATQYNATDWKWLASADSVRGYSSLTVWLCPGYSLRKDLSEIFSVLHTRDNVTYESK